MLIKSLIWNVLLTRTQIPKITICCKWTMISNLRSSECIWLLRMRRYKGNCKFLLRWFRDGFSWSSYDLHPNIIPANFFWVKSVRWPRFPETFRRLPKISDEFPKTSERCRKLNVRRLFPKTFEHFWSYLKDDTFSVLWYDFVRTPKGLKVIMC